MKIIVIEDSNIKYSLIVEALRSDNLDLEIVRAASYQSGIESLVNESFHKVILDMTLPNYDMRSNPIGVNMMTFGGELILREMVRRGIGTPTIVLSQYSSFVRGTKEVTFEELRVDLEERYEKIIIGAVRLERGSTVWITELIKLVRS